VVFAVLLIACGYCIWKRVDADERESLSTSSADFWWSVAGLVPAVVGSLSRRPADCGRRARNRCDPLGHVNVPFGARPGPGSTWL